MKVKQTKKFYRTKKDISLPDVINIRKFNKKKEIDDVQEFENISFKIKLESIDGEDNYARLFFFNDNSENEIEIPDGIICKDVTYKKSVIKKPLPDTNYFLITHPMKYIIYYDSVNKRKTTKKTKIYSINIDLNDNECDEEDSNDKMNIKKE